MAGGGPPATEHSWPFDLSFMEFGTGLAKTLMVRVKTKKLVKSMVLVASVYGRMLVIEFEEAIGI
jgi:hypothetical protein